MQYRILSTVVCDTLLCYDIRYYITLCTCIPYVKCVIFISMYLSLSLYIYIYICTHTIIYMCIYIYIYIYTHRYYSFHRCSCFLLSYFFVNYIIHDIVYPPPSGASCSLLCMFLTHTSDYNLSYFTIISLYIYIYVYISIHIHIYRSIYTLYIAYRTIYSLWSYILLYAPVFCSYTYTHTYIRYMHIYTHTPALSRKLLCFGDSDTTTTTTTTFTTTTTTTTNNNNDTNSINIIALLTTNMSTNDKWPSRKLLCFGDSDSFENRRIEARRTSLYVI